MVLAFKVAIAWRLARCWSDFFCSICLVSVHFPLPLSFHILICLKPWVFSLLFFLFSAVIPLRLRERANGSVETQLHQWASTHHNPIESYTICNLHYSVILVTKKFFYELIWINSSYHICVPWQIRNKYLTETKMGEQRLTGNCWEHIEPRVKSIKVLIKHIWLN